MNPDVTLGVEVYPHVVIARDPRTHRTRSTIFNIWELAGDPRYPGSGPIVYSDAANCVIVMLAPGQAAAKNRWLHRLGLPLNTPIVFCRNKSDLVGEPSGPGADCEMSVRDGTNLGAPFEFLEAEFTRRGH